jgi:large subunit ribosomal protein L18
MSSRKDFDAKKIRRLRRKRTVRRKIFGSPDHPRLTVFRSHKNIYCQLIDDFSGNTLASASTREKGSSSGDGDFCGNVGAAKMVGQKIAEKAQQLGIGAVQFDRNGYKFHGRVKALADAARDAGLKF